MNYDEIMKIGDSLEKEYINQTTIPHFMSCSSDDESVDEREKIYKDELAQLDFDLYLWAKNYQRDYFTCVKEIMKHDISIISIKTYPEFYMNSSGSGMAKVSFKFSCRKGGWAFEICFDDDCDCLPGTLIAESAVNTLNNQCGCYTDLFCQNTHRARLTSFLILVDSISFEEFIGKRYDKYFQLISRLRDDKFEIVVEYLSEALLLSQQAQIVPVHSCYDKFMPYAHIRCYHGECVIFLLENWEERDSKKKDDLNLMVCAFPIAVSYPGKEGRCGNIERKLYKYIERDVGIDINNIVGNHNIFEIKRRKDTYHLDYEKFDYEDVIDAMHNIIFSYQK